MKQSIISLAAIMLCGTLTASAADVNSSMRACHGEVASTPMDDCHRHKDGVDSMLKHSGVGDTPGWMLLTPSEREAFADKLRAVRSRDECQVLVDQRRSEIEKRARATGQRLAHEPRHHACMGIFKPESGAHEHSQSD